MNGALMRNSVRDRRGLRAVSPAALAAFARAAGWRRGDPYRENSDIYIGETLPEVVLPRTERLGDYAAVVAGLIGTFAEVSGQDESGVYRSLVTAERDLVRIAVSDSEGGSIDLGDGAGLVGGIRDLMLSVACSLPAPKAVYRPGANLEAVKLVERLRLAQTDQGSFVVTVLTPVVSPALFPDADDPNPPVERRLTRRLVEALAAVREATERVVTGHPEAFERAVERGVSANLCDALVRIIEPFLTLDVGVLWARTRPTEPAGTVIRFGRSDGALLREAAQSFRERAPRPDVRLHGFVRRLKRGEVEEDGTIGLWAEIDGQRRSVVAVLEQADYERVVEAHRDRSLVALAGDLERVGKRWRLLNPAVEGVLRPDEPESEDD